jgi:hypothetical protein
MRELAQRACLALLLFVASGVVGCRGLSDPGIEYRECVEPGSPYHELFNDGYRALPERCWTSQNAVEGDLSIGDSDLVASHAQAVRWDGVLPMLLRHVEGDFVMVTKTEVSAGSTSDFCDLQKNDATGEYDASGLIVLGEGVRQAFLLRPFLEESTSITCEDESANPPKALAFVPQSDTGEFKSTGGIGLDGEGDIAVCRRGSNLSYWFRDPVDPEAPWQTLDWKHLEDTDEVGEGPLDVGLTVTITEASLSLSIEGHFNWVVLTDLSDDCRGPLEDMKNPEPD